MGLQVETGRLVCFVLNWSYVVIDNCNFKASKRKKGLHHVVMRGTLMCSHFCCGNELKCNYIYINVQCMYVSRNAVNEELANLRPIVRLLAVRQVFIRNLRWRFRCM